MKDYKKRDINGRELRPETLKRTNLGFLPVERPLPPADLHATMLHALGLNQHKLTYSHNNRDEIPTVFGGEVIKEVFA